MYNLLYYNIKKMDDSLFESELAALEPLQRDDILKKAKPEDRKRSLAGIMLTKQYLSKMHRIDPEKIVFARGEHGKPYVLNLPVHFNISHSGQYVVLAVSDEPIGIDTEVVRDFSAILAKKLFNEKELSYIAGDSSTRKKSVMQRCFYELWTAKEAYLKYTGLGLSGGMQSLTLEKEKGELVPNRKDISLKFDYSVPGAVTAIVTARH